VPEKLAWILHPIWYWMWPSNLNLGAGPTIELVIDLLNGPEPKFELDGHIQCRIGCGHPIQSRPENLAWMAASNINLDAAIRARFSGSASITGSAKWYIKIMLINRISCIYLDNSPKNEITIPTIIWLIWSFINLIINSTPDWGF
jgi:hypothetical protein